MKYKVLSIKYKIIFLTAILYTAYCILYTSAAHAAGIDLGISPPILQIEAEPPASIKTPVTLENYGDTTLELDIFFKPFKASDKENGEVEYLLPDEFSGTNPLIYQNMQILENDHVIKNITLAPKQEKTVTLHIGVLKDEPISDYYFSVIFISKTNQSEEINASETPGGIATNVLLSIGPKGKTEGIIEEFSVPIFLEKGPVPFTVRVKNTGEHSIAPRGEILIKNMFGQLVGKVDLLPVNILSNSIRAIPDSLQSPNATPSSTINYKLITKNYPVALWRESFLLGPYSAKLTIALSDQGPIFSKTIYFISLPIQTLLGLIITLFIIIFIRYRIKNHLR